jgi:beta-glucosidase
MIIIDPAATHHPFSVWDYCSQNFVTKPGECTVYVGSSAENTPHTTTLAIAS